MEIQQLLWIFLLVLIIGAVLGASFSALLRRENGSENAANNQAKKPTDYDKAVESMHADDSQPLTEELVMEAIRYNGFVPDLDGNWITFRVEGHTFAIERGRLPDMSMVKIYGLDHKERDIEVMKETARQISDEIFMSKMLIWGDYEDQVAFQVALVREEYGHFKRTMMGYVHLIQATDEHSREVYDQILKQREESSAASASSPSSAEDNKNKYLS